MTEQTFECVVQKILRQVLYLSFMVQFVFQVRHKIHGNLEGNTHTGKTHAGLCIFSWKGLHIFMEMFAYFSSL